MSAIYVIGDVHGKFRAYAKLLSSLTPDSLSLQVGDFGLLPGSDYPGVLPDGAKFIRGNHDSPEIARRHPGFAGDYGFLPEYGVFVIGGAESLDRDLRTPGRDWWPEEELSDERLQHALDLYGACKPEIVVSHDCPSVAVPAMPVGGLDFPRSRTVRALDRMLEAHTPKLWIHGHWHVSRDQVVGSTRFRSLAELEAWQIPEGSVV